MVQQRNRYNYLSMKDDKECQFSIERVSQRGPFYQQPAGRLSNLRSKVAFYEGQIDPLFTQNNSVKHSLTALSRLVSISTEILRGLLPVGNDPAKKLKLEMASIDEIARMIQLDWRDMEERIAQLEVQTEELREEARRWEMSLRKEQGKHVEEVLKLQQHISSLIEAYQLKLRELREADELLRNEWAGFKQTSERQKAAHYSLVESMDRELALFKQEARCKQDDFRRCISRLKDQNAASLIEFEESKKTLKLICQRMANERLQEQAEAYELIVKAKEQEKIVLRRQIEEQADIFQVKMSSKEQEISTIRRSQSALRDELRGVEDLLYQKKEELTRQQVQNKSLQQELSRANRSGEALTEKLNKYQKNIEELKQELKETVQIYEFDLKMLREQGGQAIKRKEEQNKILKQNLIQKDKEIREMLSNFEEAELQMVNKLNADRRAYEIKESELAEEISRQIKRVAEEKEKAQRIEQQKALQLQKMVQEHKKMFEQLQKERQKEREEMIQRQSKKIAKMKAEIQQQLTKMMLANDQQLSRQRSKYEGQIKKKQDQHTAQLAKQQELFFIERNLLSSHLQKAKRQQQQLEEKLAHTIQEAERQKQERKKEKAENVLKMQALRQACALQAQMLQEQMAIQRAQLLRQVQIREGKIASLKQQFSQQRQQLNKRLLQKDEALKTLKASHLQELYKLKQASGLASIQRGFQQKLSEMSQKHNNQISMLKGNFAHQISQLQKQNLARIVGVRQELQRQLDQQNKNWQNQLSTLNQQYHQSFIDIAKATEKRSVFFDDKFLVIDIERDLGKATRQQKAEFIIGRIEEKNSEIIRKTEQANRLKNELQKYQRYFEEQLKNRKQQLEREKDMMIADCFRQIQEKELECRNRIEVVEQERINFSLQIRDQFTSLISKHDKEVTKLRIRCEQLQKILAQRPSRAEDVSKIKQLINIQAKLDQQISICNRKIDTANEIVKYLNLQLANYKETYDIFGPSNQSPFNNKTVSFKQSNNLQQYRDDRWLERNTDSPDIKELQVFADKESNRSQDQYTLLPKDVKEMPSKRKYSLMAEKPRERFRTQKQGKGDTIIEHASTFMRLIKADQQGPELREGQVEDPKKKTYRKRKLKRLNTNVEHYF